MGSLESIGTQMSACAYMEARSVSRTFIRFSVASKSLTPSCTAGRVSFLLFGLPFAKPRASLSHFPKNSLRGRHGGQMASSCELNLSNCAVHEIVRQRASKLASPPNSTVECRLLTESLSHTRTMWMAMGIKSGMMTHCVSSHLLPAPLGKGVRERQMHREVEEE